MSTHEPNQPDPTRPDPTRPDLTQPGTAALEAEPVGHDGIRVDISESRAWSRGTGTGILSLLVSLALFFGGIGLIIGAAIQLESETTTAATLTLIGGVIALIAGIIGFTTVTIVPPGQTSVRQFFGRYIGTIRHSGLAFIPPFTSGKKVSVKVHNFETNELKVNDSDGNPINIAAVVVWQVADTARASYAVENYEEFIQTQAESALRHVATTHPYDEPAPGEQSLRGSTDTVSAELAHEVAERVALAGLEIIEVRISSLAYAPEIAQAMLQRQQAGAIIAARELIVEGAVTMVDHALQRLENDGVVVFDDERKAQMVSNLLVVLTSDQRVTPVINSGSLYS